MPTDLQVLQQKLAAAQASPSLLKAGDLTPGYERIEVLQTGGRVGKPAAKYPDLLASNPT